MTLPTNPAAKALERAKRCFVHASNAQSVEMRNRWIDDGMRWHVESLRLSGQLFPQTRVAEFLYAEHTGGAS